MSGYKWMIDGVVVRPTETIRVVRWVIGSEPFLDEWKSGNSAKTRRRWSKWGWWARDHSFSGNGLFTPRFVSATYFATEREAEYELFLICAKAPTHIGRLRIVKVNRDEART